jgi:pimeloyl-ACP methyl ester carboxylesterase
MTTSSRRATVPAFLGFLLILLTFGGCAAPKPTVVVVVGGLGFSQLGDLRHAVESQCPDAKVVNAGGIDGYKADIKSIATSKKYQNVVLIGHSLGCPAIATASEQLPKVDLAVFIDPAWDDFRLPKNISRSLWYKRSEFGFERKARIVGASPPTTIQGGHNNIPHSPELIASVVSAINSMKITKPPARKTVTADADTSPKPTANGRMLVSGSPTR